MYKVYTCVLSSSVLVLFLPNSKKVHPLVKTPAKMFTTDAQALLNEMLG